MITNPDHSAKTELDLPGNGKILIVIVLEEGREAAQEHQTQDPASKLIFKCAEAGNNGTQTSQGKFKVKKTVAIAAGEDTLAFLFVCVGTTKIGKGV